MVISQRTINGKTSQEKRYYLSSHSIDAESFAKKVRNHWSVENSLHWVLDVDFNEDQSRVRSEFAPQNASWMRALALSLLKREPTVMSIRRKINQAIDSTDYILKVLLNKGC
jgi:predicted transposase YbfD/YdcC